MKVENKFLFPLHKILPTIKPMYFMDEHGCVYSNASGVLTRLHGSTTHGVGRKFTLRLATSGSYRKTIVEHAAKIRWKAKQHPDFERETAEEITLGSLGVDMSKLKPVSLTGRTHATTTEEGIKARGSIIGRLHKGHLVFGSEPKIHLDAKSVESELKRLALEHPGVTFVECKITRSIVAGGVTWG